MRGYSDYETKDILAEIESDREHQRLKDAVVEAVKARFLKEQADGWGYSDSETKRVKDAEHEAIENLLQFEKDHGLEFKEGQE